ncbi:MAG: nuclear transport factor 2 family protein [Pseudomonadota bacterium]
MKMISIRRIVAHVAAVGLCAALVGTSAAQAGEKMTAQSLIDRQQILDQITRYYYNFGRANKAPEVSFYTEDAVFILGAKRYEGHEGIKQAYGRPPTPPAAGAAPAAPRERTPFNVTVDNALIIVHGDTATSEVIYTEYRTQQVDDKPKLVFTTQGKEFATWVKVKGQWLYKSRQLTGDSNPPEGWKE